MWARSCRRAWLPQVVQPSSRATREQFDMWPRRAGFDDVVLFIRLSAVFALAGSDIVYLPTPGRQCSRVLSANAKKIISVTLQK